MEDEDGQEDKELVELYLGVGLDIAVDGDENIVNFLDELLLN